MAAMIGNRYIVVKLIGEGGMADVYLAVDSILKRDVAIKVLRGELNNDPVNLRRFQREASAITNLSHPNIVEVFDVGEDNKRNYIVMEYVPGKTLKQLIKQRGALYSDEAINIMKQLVSATAHAHHNGIIHRDIKSQNVMIKDDGTVKLSDFGIAFTGDSQQLTQTDTVMGSVHYLAPELAKGQQATVQSDIYALGIVFYEMLTGDVPFHADAPVQIALKHLHEPVPSVRNFNPELPQSVENIIIRATAKDPEQRYKSADEMYDDLVTCLDFSRSKEPRLVLHKPKQPTVSPEPIKVRRKKNTITAETVLGIMAALLLCAALVLIIMSVSGKMTPPAKKVTVPDVTNYDIDSATMVLSSYDLNIQDIKYEVTDNLAKGKIIKTTPSAGSEIEEKGYVILYVSLGKYFTVENYVGKNIATVKSALEAEGIIVNVTEVEDSKNKSGTIIEQNVEAGTVFDPANRNIINFTVAVPVSFAIPTNYEGMSVENVKRDLEDRGATVVVKQLPAEENIDPETGEYKHKPGTVVGTNPDGGTFYVQEEGRSIEIYYY